VGGEGKRRAREFAGVRARGIQIALGLKRDLDADKNLQKDACFYSPAPFTES
jgi:hypothetical protein